MKILPLLRHTSCTILPKHNPYFIKYTIQSLTLGGSITNYLTLKQKRHLLLGMVTWGQKFKRFGHLNIPYANRQRLKNESTITLKTYNRFIRNLPVLYKSLPATAKTTYGVTKLVKENLRLKDSPFLNEKSYVGVNRPYLNSIRTINKTLFTGKYQRPANLLTVSTLMVSLDKIKTLHRYSQLQDAAPFRMK